MIKRNDGTHSAKLIKRAILLSMRGYGPAEISKHLKDEGHTVGKSTIEYWIYHMSHKNG